MDAGPCTQGLERWYFDTTAGYCRQFSYGGCEGNDNRFQNNQLCRESCVQWQKKVEDPEQKPEPEPEGEHTDFGTMMVKL